MVDVQAEAAGNVERLLAMVCNDKTDPGAYKFVHKELTRLAVIGTLPAGCRSNANTLKKQEG